MMTESINSESDFMRFNSTLTAGHWSLRRPAGWKVEQPSRGKTVLVGPRVGPFNAGLMVDELQGDENDLVRLMSRLADEQSELPHYQCIEEKDLSTDAYSALYVRTSWYHEKADVTMLTQQIFCLFEGAIFVLTSSTPNSSARGELLNLMTEMLNSFRFSVREESDSHISMALN